MSVKTLTSKCRFLNIGQPLWIVYVRARVDMIHSLTEQRCLSKWFRTFCNNIPKQTLIIAFWIVFQIYTSTSAHITGIGTCQ